MKRIVAVVAAGLCACLVQAELFWISYDASCGLYPEEVGWTAPHTAAARCARWPTEFSRSTPPLTA